MFELAIQKAIYDTLTADAQLMALVVGVYDAVPQAPDSGNPSDFPYIVIGDDISTEWSTNTEIGRETSLTMHIWSRYRGKKEIKNISDNIARVLDRAELTIENLHAVTIDFTQSQSFLEPDALTNHGVIEFRLLSEAV